jgi:hypothetical protein
MSYNPNVLYDTGVLAAATQTITVPSATMNGVTSCKIEISSVNNLGTNEVMSLFVNSDTTPANYTTIYENVSSATQTQGAAGGGVVGQSYAGNESVVDVSVRVLNGKMMYRAQETRENAAGTGIDAVTLSGKSTAGTVTDLQGMTLQTTNANGWGIGSRVIVYKN